MLLLRRRSQRRYQVTPPLSMPILFILASALVLTLLAAIEVAVLTTSRHPDRVMEKFSSFLSFGKAR